MQQQHIDITDNFDISSYGFLTDPQTIPTDLPPNFDEYVEIVNNISNQDGMYFRSLVDNLEKGLPHSFYTSKIEGLSYSQKKQIYCVFTFIAQKYVRCMGKGNETTSIPYEIGLVWHAVAKEFKLPCVSSYAALILYNCLKNDDGTLRSKYAISDLSDELHFYKIHMDIEKAGGELLNALVINNMTSEQESIELFDLATKTIEEITYILKNMYNGCDPEKFWNHIRIYLAGYPDGLKVKNTDLEFKFNGGSAAQSTLIQAIDIFVGVEHDSDSDHGIKFLKDQRKYMPEKHQQYLIFLEQKYTNRGNIYPDSEEILFARNNTLKALTEFRKTHYGIVHKYIVKFTKIESMQHNNVHGEKGAGGMLTTQLEEYIADTRNAIDNTLYADTNNTLDDTLDADTNNTLYVDTNNTEELDDAKTKMYLNKRLKILLCYWLWCALCIFASIYIGNTLQ